jgi:hypothetical protein
MLYIYLNPRACSNTHLSTEKSTISWGQNAQNGELGHGAGKPKSATNAVKVNSLDGAHVFSVSCGVGHTLALVDVADPVLKTLEKMPVRIGPYIL